jgi:hypothetical protein
MLRGREAVRADHRLCADEKHIRTQSTILDKSNPKPWLLLSITMFSGTDALFIRTKNMVGARSVQWPLDDIGGRRKILRTAAS